LMKAATFVVTVSLSILACSQGPPDAGRTGAAPTPVTPPAVTPPAPVTPPAVTPPAPVTPPGGTADETLCGEVRLTAAKVVPAGKTLAICAGSSVTAAGPTVGLTVQGKLVVQGEAGKPVKFAGAQGGSTDWTGIAVAAGGEVSATQLEIRNARTALETKPGAAFTIDHLVIESCDAMLVLASGGSIAHGTLHGLGQNQASTPVAVTDASPGITDT